MTNRVTDQKTQNALISEFKLEGLLAEMMVEHRIVPVVQVATLLEEANITDFEKWRSVLLGMPFVNPNDITAFVGSPFLAGKHNYADTSNSYGGNGAVAAAASFGCRLPGGAVGVPATNGVYRVTVWCGGVGSGCIVLGPPRGRSTAPGGAGGSGAVGRSVGWIFRCP